MISSQFLNEPGRTNPASFAWEVSTYSRSRDTWSPIGPRAARFAIPTFFRFSDTFARNFRKISSIEDSDWLKKVGVKLIRFSDSLMDLGRRNGRV